MTAAIRRETPVALLLLKLEAWMKQQPEWLSIVALPRQQRRAAMRELANRLYTIPTADTGPTLTRETKRSKNYKGFLRVAEQKAARNALAEALLMEEAQASVALDKGDVGTQSVEPSPDPEGDVKADVELAKEAEEAKDAE